MAEFYETILAEDFDDARLADLEDIVSESVPMERLNNSVSY